MYPIITLFQVIRRVVFSGDPSIVILFVWFIQHEPTGNEVTITLQLLKANYF